MIPTISTFVPQLIPTSVDLLTLSAVTLEAPVPIVSYASNISSNSPTSAINSIIPIALQEQHHSQSITPVQIPPPPHEPPAVHLYSSAISADQNTNIEQIPCINPNFSKIVELSLTPSPPPIAEEPSENSNDNSAVSSPYHTNEQTITATAPQLQNQQQSMEPKIPISHLMATNQYPSLNRMPPANIVHSFAPVYNQSNLESHQQQQHQRQSYGDELYSSYVNNPYNLTLDQNFANNQTAVTTTTAASVMDSGQNSQPSTLNEPLNMIQTSNASNSNVFQSRNYFGATYDATIPPGSEVLFGGP